MIISRQFFVRCQRRDFHIRIEIHEGVADVVRPVIVPGGDQVLKQPINRALAASLLKT
jgi:hypothetical protein